MSKSLAPLLAVFAFASACHPDGGVDDVYESFDTPGYEIPAGGEASFCVSVKLSNAERSMARRLLVTLPGSNGIAFTLYRTGSPQNTPTPCSRGDNMNATMGAGATLSPLFRGTQGTTELTFPSVADAPVGPALEPQQLLLLEVQALNPTDQPLKVSAHVEVDHLPFPQNGIASDMSLVATAQISIPPTGTHTIGPKFQTLPANTSVFALQPEMGRAGLQTRVWVGSNPSVFGDTLVVTSKNWIDAPLHELSTPNTQGVAFECTYFNDTSRTRTFGWDADSERCQVWQYYYPAQGFKVCIDGACL